MELHVKGTVLGFALSFPFLLVSSLLHFLFHVLKNYLLYYASVVLRGQDTLSPLAQDAIDPC